MILQFLKNAGKQWIKLVIVYKKGDKAAASLPSAQVCSPSAVVFVLFTQHSPASALSSPVKWLSSEHKALMRKHTKALIWRRSVTQEYCTNQIPPAIQTRSFSYGLLLPAVWLAWPWGQLLTLLPLHFLLSLPAASPLFSTAPWKGGWNKCYQPSRRQTAPFCLWLLLYHRAFMAQRKPASVETTMASERTSPSPLLLTHTPFAPQVQPTSGEGRTEGGLYGTCTMITRAADECMPALKPTTIEMQLNTQRFI